MRNWNFFASSVAQSSPIVFSVPMRNWNKLPAAGVLDNKQGFQRTYEELKLGFLSIEFGQGSLVFSVPMRNWNIAVEGWLQVRQYGFQRTYEELKQPSSQNTTFLKFKFSAYLWGIETGGICDGDDQQRLFSAYLWGIETWKECNHCI